jgi:16S rRNA processing protein RimM
MAKESLQGSKLIVLCRLRKVFGIKGEIKAEYYGEDPMFLLRAKRLFLLPPDYDRDKKALEPVKTPSSPKNSKKGRTGSRKRSENLDSGTPPPAPSLDPVGRETDIKTEADAQKEGPALSPSLTPAASSSPVHPLSSSSPSPSTSPSPDSAGPSPSPSSSSSPSALPSPEPRRVKISGVRVSPPLLILSFDKVTDRDAAALLVGSYLAVRRDELPPPGEDEIYLTDLIGLKVLTEEGKLAGTLRAVPEHGGNPLLLILSPEGREIFVPWTAEFIKESDPEKGFIVISPIPGLLDED